MTTATITPLSTGQAVVELHGFPKPCESLWAAIDFARDNNAEVNVLRFPAPSIERAARGPLMFRDQARGSTEVTPD